MSSHNPATLAPSRAQPKRAGKDVVYDFGDKVTASDFKRSRTIFFETSKTLRPSTTKLISQGEVRRELAKQVNPHEAHTGHAGPLPPTMSFGPNGGCGAGIYDEASGNIFRVGNATCYWAILEEISPTAPAHGARKKRHGATYFSVVALHRLRLVPGTYVRSNPEAVISYFVNGTMISAHDLDPEGLIPVRLLSADVWFRVLNWFGRVPAKSICAIAVPERAPPIARERGHATSSVPADRDGFFCGGVVTIADDSPDYTINSVQLWDGDSADIFSESRPQDAPFCTQLTTVQPFNFFEAATRMTPQIKPSSRMMLSERMQFMWKAIMLEKSASSIQLVDACSLSSPTPVGGWRAPQVVLDKAGVAQSQLEKPRETRDYLFMARELVRIPSMQSPKPEQLAGAETCLVVMPQVHLPLFSFFFASPTSLSLSLSLTPPLARRCYP